LINEGRSGNVQNVLKSADDFDICDESGGRKGILIWGSRQFLAFNLNGVPVVYNFQT